MQLLGSNINISGQDIVGNDVFDEGSLIVFFLIIGARLVHCDGSQYTDAPGHRVVPGNEHRIIVAKSGRSQQFIGSTPVVKICSVASMGTL
jgi:hypothetical protein